MARQHDDSIGMACSCGGPTRVIDSRYDGEKRRRRHQCRECDARVTTYEITAEEYDNLQAVKINLSAVNEAIRALEVVKRAVSG